MNTSRTLFGSSLLALILCGAAAAQNTTGTETRIQQPVAPRHRHARGELRRFLRTLQLSDAQKSVALEQARAADPIAHSARVEASRIRAQALRDHPEDRAAAREEMRGQLKNLRQQTLEQLRPLAKRVLSTLTPEQRTKLADAAKKRGRTVDESRMENVTSWLLTQPGVRGRLERPATR
jgi:Spy/CpxP family protein refolding chaperone